MAKETALVTGASGGIGYEMAKLLARRGCDLVLVARSGDRLEEIARDLNRHHLVKVRVFAKDLSQLNAIDEIHERLTESGTRIDHLINNAGFGDFGFFTDTQWDKELKMIQLNIIALTYLTKLFAKDMIQAGSGRIMNVASTAAFQPGPKMAVYFATKAYVLSFSEAIANELEGTGVSVTTLCPGLTASGFQEASAMHESGLLRRGVMANAQEVAAFGIEAMLTGKPLAIHGTVNKLLAGSVRLFPRSWITKAARYMQDSKN